MHLKYMSLSGHGTVNTNWSNVTFRITHDYIMPRMFRKLHPNSTTVDSDQNSSKFGHYVQFFILLEINASKSDFKNVSSHLFLISRNKLSSRIWFNSDDCIDRCLQHETFSIINGRIMRQLCKVIPGSHHRRQSWIVYHTLSSKNGSLQTMGQHTARDHCSLIEAW